MKSPFKLRSMASAAWMSASCGAPGRGADDICWSLVYTDIPNHEPSCLMLNTGPTGWAAVHGRVADLRAWHRESESSAYVVLCPACPPRWVRRCGAMAFCRPSTRGLISPTSADRGRFRRRRNARRRRSHAEICRERQGRQGDPPKGVIERSSNPKKLVSYVNNPKFSLVEQRRELDLLQKLEKCARTRPAPIRKWKRSSSPWKWRTGCRPKRRTSSMSARNRKPRWIFTVREPWRAAASPPCGWPRRASA